MALQLEEGKFLFVDDSIANSQACCCGGCEDCCTGFTEPDEIIVDLGAGGLTNDLCGAGNCEGLAGEFTLDKTTVSGNICKWSLDIASFCTGGTSGDLEMRLDLIIDGSQCYWHLEIEYSDLFSFDSSGATYESTPTEFGETECELASPLNLSKITEDWSTFEVCEGSLPATITIEAAP